MIAGHAEHQTGVRDGAAVDASGYASAILNILDDSAEEKARLGDSQRAILNILDDSAEEKARLGDSQRAILNILDDFDIEKNKVEQANVELRSEIAERARAEEALRQATAATEVSNRELEAFSYSVSHDLRAPLRAIDGFSAELLSRHADRLDETGKRYLGIVREASQDMGHLIDDLLRLSLVSRSEMRHEVVDLSAMASEIAAGLARAEPHRRVRTEVDEGLRAVADRALIRAALENLVANAWKFTAKRPDAAIRVGRLDGREPATFYVADNGAGFDMAYAAKLFGAFQRLHAQEEFPGTGIGLATVQRVVRRHGGTVWAEAAVDKGATFYFTLPTPAHEEAA